MLREGLSEAEVKLVRRCPEVVRLVRDDVDLPGNRILTLEDERRKTPVTSPPSRKAAPLGCSTLVGPSPVRCSSASLSGPGGKSHRLTGAALSHLGGRLGTEADRLNVGL